ncbi:MAG: Rrf2 family transcriptional regulator [Elusimicrobia bacterium]|nr:Rrf2 family transcriptional regulator [Candidatus Liberimonas magnetica]
MKISFKGDYALKIILDLSLSYKKGLSQIRDISKRLDIPEKYLEQIVTILKGAKYIKTQRGPKGGISLSKAPNQITLGEVIRLMEGPTSPVTCVSKSCYTRCNFESKCSFKSVWEDVRDRVNEVVDKTTFQDMVEKTIKMNRKNILDYNI